MSSNSSDTTTEHTRATPPRFPAVRATAVAAATLAVMALSSVLTTAAEARGSGGGHHGGGMRLGAPMRMHSFHGPRIRPHLIVRRHVFEPKIVHRHEPAHVAHAWKHKRHTLRIRNIVRDDDADGTPAVRKAKVLRNVAPLRQAVAAPEALKLSPVQYQNAAVADAQGRRFDAARKMWFDGKHWWRGAWAWLLIDGVWHYGNRPWTEVNGRWTTDGPNQPQCVDCDAPAAGPAKIAAGASGDVSGVASGGEASDKPVKVAKVAFTKHDGPAGAAAKSVAGAAAPAAAPCPAVKTAETSTKPEADRGAAPAGECLAEAASSDTSTDASPGTNVATAAAEPEAGVTATECRQFVPAIGMTIAVPCGD